MTDSDTTREYAYDAAGRLASVKADGKEVRFGYDKRGDLASIAATGEEVPPTTAPAATSVPAQGAEPAPSAAPAFCTNCGAERVEGAQFCKQCGRAL